MKLQVVACDIDQKFPAMTYTITASDGRSIAKDLCKEHAAPIEEWLGESEAEDGTEPQPEPERPAKKAAAKKTASARRRPKITSLEEIEATKKG